MSILKIVSWNVNGIRSLIIDNLSSNKYKGKTEITTDSNLAELINDCDPNIICFQETRCGQPKMDQIKLPDWKIYSSSSQGNGARSADRYSGVSTWVHTSLGEPDKVVDILPLNDTTATSSCRLEGRFLVLIFSKYIIVNTYVPNAGTNYINRTQIWDPVINEYLNSLKTDEVDKMIIWAGDLNVARTTRDVHFGDVRSTSKVKALVTTKSLSDQQLIDLQNKYDLTPAMRGIGKSVSAGFTLLEREGFIKILDSGFTDCWRHLHPDETNGFTWWNLRIPSYRPANKGWRIDYIVVNNEHLGKLIKCLPLPKIGTKTKNNTDIGKYGSDHAPIFASFSLD